MNKKTEQVIPLDLSPSLSVWNRVSISAVILVLFFLFTNGVPLVQWGWIAAFRGKESYVNLMRIPVSILFSLFLYLYLKKPSIFYRLTIVRFVNNLLEKYLSALLIILTLGYIVTLSTISTLRYNAGEGGDLAIFVQAIWNGTRGDFLYTSIKNDICLLGEHMSPIMAFVVPLYRIWSNPILTFILQAMTIGSGIYFTGVIAQEKLKSNFLASIFALMYFFYFNARAALHYEFHPEALVEPWIFLAFIYLEKKKLVKFLLSLLIVIFGKENMLGIAFIFGFYILAFKPWKRLGICLMVVSLAFFLFELKWLMPHLSGISYQYNYYWPLKVPLGEALEYMLRIYSPLLFLSFFHFPTLLLTFPILFQNMLSQNELLRDSARHYTIGLHPFLFISGIYGFHSICERWKVIADQKNLVIGIVFWFSLLRSGPSEYFYAWNFIKAKPPYDAEMLHQIEGIGSQYSVLTQAEYITRLINRKHLYILNAKVPPTYENIQKYRFDYIVFDESHWPLSDQPIAETFQKLKAWGYTVSFSKNGFYILKSASAEK